MSEGFVLAAMFVLSIVYPLGAFVAYGAHRLLKLSDYRKYATLIKFIKENRKVGAASFKIVTTSDEIIIYTDDTRYTKSKIRILYK